MRVKQLYLPNTNILLTRLLSEKGVAEITDFMPVGNGPERKQRYGNHIIRVLRVIKGQVRFAMRCAPRFDYARSGHRAEAAQGAVVFTPDCSDVSESGAARNLSAADRWRRCHASFTLNAGETAMMAFGEAPTTRRCRRGLDPAAVEELFHETSRFWRDWIGRSNYRGRWREMVDRSALVLKLLISAEHGSLIAAATFGLPEKIGGERNWDYRYTWLRDSAFTHVRPDAAGLRRGSASVLSMDSRPYARRCRARAAAGDVSRRRRAGAG